MSSSMCCTHGYIWIYRHVDLAWVHSTYFFIKLIYITRLRVCIGIFGSVLASVWHLCGLCAFWTAIFSSSHHSLASQPNVVEQTNTSTYTHTLHSQLVLIIRTNEKEAARRTPPNQPNRVIACCTLRVCVWWTMMATTKRHDWRVHQSTMRL